MNNQVSVVIPSRKRTDQLVGVIENLLEVSLPQTEIIVVCDGDKKSFDRIQDFNITSILNPIRVGAIESWNEGAAIANGDFFFLGADDLVFKKGWDVAGIQAIWDLNRHGVIAYTDGSDLSAQLATHYLVSRSWCVNELGGVLVIPSYKHYFVDNEITMRAKLSKKIRWLKPPYIEHRHWVWGTAEKDDVHREAEESYQSDGEIHAKRMKLWFPNDWEPRIEMIRDAAEGWGRIAVSPRMYKSPEPKFVNSWSHLLLGLKPGDTFLEGPSGLAAHLAAGEITRGFLNSRAHSVLMVDDDMVIPRGALDIMRSNSDNWEYDIVMGFCTQKNIPPHAIVYKLVDQPNNPEALKGEHYGALREIPDNTVVPVDAVGLAFTLIKRRVLEALTNEYGAMYTPYFEWGKFTEGEDIVFSRWARENGFTLAVDTNVKIGHVGDYVHGWDSFHDWLKQLEQQGK